MGFPTASRFHRSARAAAGSHSGPVPSAPDPAPVHGISGRQPRVEHAVCPTIADERIEGDRTDRHQKIGINHLARCRPARRKPWTRDTWTRLFSQDRAGSNEPAHERSQATRHGGPEEGNRAAGRLNDRKFLGLNTLRSERLPDARDQSCRARSVTVQRNRDPIFGNDGLFDRRKLDRAAERREQFIAVLFIGTRGRLFGDQPLGVDFNLETVIVAVRHDHFLGNQDIAPNITRPRRDYGRIAAPRPSTRLRDRPKATERFAHDPFDE